jgi:hypothetical protein
MDLGNMVIRMINASSKTLEDSLKGPCLVLVIE